MTVIEVIDAHIPSLTDEDDLAIDGAMYQVGNTNADLAIRTCMCGKKIDGFYEYTDHLKEVLRDAGLVETTGRRLT